MKKILLIFGLFSSLNTIGQKKINEIIDIEGRIYYEYCFEGEVGFYLINKKDTIQFVFGAGPNDKLIECKVDSDLYINIIAGLLPKNTRLRVKAKATYALFSPVCTDCEQFKAIVWKPIEIIRLSK